jgi:CheY-like chemotaxis protein
MATNDPVKILVVDDLPEKLLVYRAILEELGRSWCWPIPARRHSKRS